MYTNFCLVPGHSEIQGNELVDQLAQSATSFPRVSPHLFPTSLDLAAIIRYHIKQKWHTQWKSLTNHLNLLAQIKPLPTPWKTSNLSSRKFEITLTRLRIGSHTPIFSHNSTP